MSSNPISGKEAKRLLGFARSTSLPAVRGFPAPVFWRRGKCIERVFKQGYTPFYNRRAVERWHERQFSKVFEPRKTEPAPEPEPKPAPFAFDDFPSRLRLSDRPNLDGIDICPAVLAAETKRMSVERLKTRSRWQHLAVDPFAKPDPAQIAKSEAINARLTGRVKPAKPAAPPITLPERVTELGFRSARAPRLLVVGPRPKVARPSNPQFSAPITGAPNRVAPQAFASAEVGL